MKKALVNEDIVKLIWVFKKTDISWIVVNLNYIVLIDLCSLACNLDKHFVVQIALYYKVIYMIF